ncbi:MAG: tetratricopeptide repeat protein [Elusimicrobia bacterium]|nr:tetratricopeptide repeat protein [Elusimicrobiota bacterium]
MSAELPALSDAARRRPLGPRRRFHEVLRDSAVTVLAADGASPENIEVWADKDPVLGGLWIPVFSAKPAAEAFAAKMARPGERSLKAVSGPAAELFGAILEVPRFAGVKVDPSARSSARLERAEVALLAAGAVPSEAPVLHALGGVRVSLPDGIPCRFGEADPSFGPPGRRALFPAAPGLTLQDFRSLVELDLSGTTAWVPCRNFAAALASAPCEKGRRSEVDETLVEALIAFGMLGEAEALCARAAPEAGREGWAAGHLGRVLRRAGRLDECIAHCRASIPLYPDESRLHRSLTLALAELEDLEAARDAARAGLERFPEDTALKRFA